MPSGMQQVSCFAEKVTQFPRKGSLQNLPGRRGTNLIFPIPLNPFLRELLKPIIQLII